MIGKGDKGVRRSPLIGAVGDSMDEPCLHCSKNHETDENSEWIECDKCHRWLHRNCCKLSSGAFDKVAQTPDALFYCHKCDKDFAKNVNKKIQEKLTSKNSDLQKILLKLNKLDDIEQSINFISEKFHLMENEIKAIKTELKSTVKTNIELRQEVSSLRHSVKSLQDEMVSKKCFLKRIEVPADQSPLLVVQEVVQSIGIRKESVVRASVKTSKNKEQFIIAEFASTDDRLKFLQSKKKLREQPRFNNTIAFDVMGAETMKIYKYAASLKPMGFKFIYERGGMIYAKKDEEDRRPAIIRSFEDVDRVLARSTTGRT